MWANRHPDMSVVRLACVVYWLVLTVLLVSPDPWSMVGIDQSVAPPGGRMLHFAFFTGLALLIAASRWPVRPGLLVGLALAFALATEALQALFPQRKVDLLDVTENLLGLGAGTAIWWLIRNRLMRPSKPRK